MNILMIKNNVHYALTEAGQVFSFTYGDMSTMRLSTKLLFTNYKRKAK